MKEKTDNDELISDLHDEISVLEERIKEKDDEISDLLGILKDIHNLSE